MSEFIIEYINSLPDDTTTINVSYRNLTYLPPLNRFYNLQSLNCSNNKLKSLPELNNTLQILYCNNNELTSLPKLNNDLHTLICNNNKLTMLPEINDSIYLLYCDNNELPYKLNHYGPLNTEQKNILNYHIHA